MKKYRLLSILTALAMVISLAACGSSGSTDDTEAEVSEDEENSEASADADAEEETADVEFDSEENTIRFGILAGNIRVAVNILASQLGYYEEEGVNVEFVEIQDTTAALTAISTDKDEIDVLGTGIVPDLTFIANGSDLVIFEGTAAEGGAIISTPENAEYYLDLSNYENITAAMVRNESAWIITRTLLVEQGVDVDSITLMEVDSYANVAQAVAKGEADVGFLPVEMANSYLDIGTEIVYEAGELDPMYVCCRQVTSAAKYEEKYDAFVKYAIANIRALEYYNDEANRDEVIAILAEFSGQTEEYVENYLFVNRTVLTQDPNEYGVADYYQALSDIGYFEDSGDGVDVNDHIDTGAYEEALSTLIERDPENEFYQEQLETFRTYNDSSI